MPMIPFFRADFTVSKRLLGLLLIAAGLIVVAASLAPDLIGGQPDGFGTVQKMAVLLGGVCAGIGLTLLPLGNRPA
jgi:hypothetical protein